LTDRDFGDMTEDFLLRLRRLQIKGRPVVIDRLGPHTAPVCIPTRRGDVRVAGIFVSRRMCVRVRG
jgi:hypothetical protein